VNSARSRWLYLAGICAVVLVLLVNVATMARQAPWEDEIFAVSTGWSLARTQPPILSVLAQYPRTGSPILFYGPVSFEAEAWLIRVFGLSLNVWRLACYVGILLCIFAGWGLVRRAGGDKWAQLATVLVITLAGSVGGTLPGRWDAVTAGLFLSGLLLFLGGVGGTGRTLLWRSTLAGVLIGFALASSPRVLTLSLSAAVAMVVTGLCFARLRGGFFGGAICIFSTALLTHTLLLLPWGLNSISWYSYLKRATREDSINATPLTGRGAWALDLHHHKALTVLLLVLLTISIYSVIKQKRCDRRTKPFKLFLSVFASVNLVLMAMVLTNALGQPTFWLPPAVAALMCWVNWESFRNGWAAGIAVSLTGVCLLLLCLEEVRLTAAVALTWDQRSTDALTVFVKHALPVGAVVYGPVGGYFYPVELSGHQYLYPYERTTPGLHSEPGASIADKLDKEICSYRTYAIWPKLDPVYHPQDQLMPAALRQRLHNSVAEFDQPALSAWRHQLLTDIGEIGGKYGFSDVVIYSLKSQHCGED
jgi:hypothetical protein